MELKIIPVTLERKMFPLLLVTTKSVTTYLATLDRFERKMQKETQFHHVSRRLTRYHEGR